MTERNDKNNKVLDKDGLEASLVFVNRRGEPAYFSVFDNCNHRHTMVIGKTGDGMSMVSHEALQAMVAHQPAPLNE